MNQASLFDNRPGPSHHTAPETSRLAALANAPRSGTQRARVLIAIAYGYGGAGLTDDEIGNATGLSGNAVRPRRGELVQGGFVIDSGTRAPSASGNPSVVWVVTPKGQDAVLEMEAA